MSAIFNLMGLAAGVPQVTQINIALIKPPNMPPNTIVYKNSVIHLFTIQLDAVSSFCQFTSLIGK